MKKTNALRKLWYGFSPRQRDFIRRMYYLPRDFMDGVTGKRHKYIPPRGLIYTGSPASAQVYFEQGIHQLNILKAYTHLKPEHHVLDIGSGVGRTAIALTTYLNEKGRYDGFDVVQNGVDWCKRTIHKDFPNFNFSYVALHNDLYNTSTNQAENYTFPYPKNNFDVIFSFSVFTHMAVDEIDNYIQQSYAVLKPEGRLLSTFFIYNDETEARISTQKDFAFSVKKEGYRLMSEKVTSGNIALHSDTLIKIGKSAGFEVESIIDGFWKTRSTKKLGQEYQDIVVFKKTS